MPRRRKAEPLIWEASVLSTTEPNHRQMTSENNSVMPDFSRIRAFAFDVDGVFTDGGILCDLQGALSYLQCQRWFRCGGWPP